MYKTQSLSKSLHEVEEALKELNFFRIHRQYLANLDHIVRFSKSDGLMVILSDKREIPVSRRQKEKLLKRFGGV